MLLDSCLERTTHVSRRGTVPDANVGHEPFPADPTF